MKKTIKGLFKLTRFNEYIYFVVITTLLGVAAANGEFAWRLLVLMLADWLAVGFAFMINDIEDAPDDALSSSKLNRNPVSAGLITPKTASLATYTVAAISLGLFALLGTWPLIFGGFSLLLGYLYSYRGVRLKTMAFLDILSHCLMLAGLQYLTGYFTFSSKLNQHWFWPFTFVMAISIYGELFNEIRDLEGDRNALLRHTVIVLGEKTSQILMLGMLVIGIFAGGVSFLMIGLIPLWVFLVLAILAALFTLPPLLKIRQGDDSMAIQSSLQKPLERAAALALFLYYFLPWLDTTLGWELF